MSLAERLKQLVGMVDGLSLRELARIAKVSETYPSLIASGSREEIGATVAKKLAKALGCSMDFLFSGTEPGPSPEDVKSAVEVARAAHRAEEEAKHVAVETESEEAPPDSNAQPNGKAKEPAA